MYFFNDVYFQFQCLISIFNSISQILARVVEECFKRSERKTTIGEKERKGTTCYAKNPPTKLKKLENGMQNGYCFFIFNM